VCGIVGVVCVCVCECACVCVFVVMYILKADWNNKTDLNLAKYSIMLVDVVNFNTKLKFV